MATENLYSGDGSDTTFDITFPYLTHADIKVSLKELKSDATSPYDANDYHYKDKADPGDYSISGNTVTFTTAPADGITGGDNNLLKNNIKITRATVITSPEHEYTAGSSITAAKLNENQKQALYAIQEAGEITATPGGISTGDKGPIFVLNDSSWSMQANSIANNHLQDNSVGINEIQADAVTAAELKDDASTDGNRAVTRNHIRNDAIDGTKIADDSIDSEHIAANSIDTEHYAPISIDSDAIKDNAVVQNKIGNDSVSESKLKVYGNPGAGLFLQYRDDASTDLIWATAKPAGSVLETFTLCCTGTSATVGSGTYTTDNVQAKQTVNRTGGWVDINGSSMTYTPPTGTKTVLYRYSYWAAGTTYAAAYHTKLLISSAGNSWAEVTAARRSPYLSDTSPKDYQHQHYFEWPFIIRSSANAAIGQLPSWDQQKTIKLQAIAYSDSYSVRFNEMEHWDGDHLGGNLSTSDALIHPTISITAIN